MERSGMVTTQAISHELGLSPGRWAIDHTHSALLFSIRHLGLAKVRGRFDRFEATLDIGQTLAESRIEAVVDLASINTNNADRDAHLRSTDFFSTDEHPEMRFVSTQISLAGDELRVDGQVTLNGRTRPLTLEVEFNGVQEFPGRGIRHAGFSAIGSLKRSDFGIEFGLLPIGIDTLALSDDVKIELDLEFIEPQGNAPNGTP
jgi:polyisoprenoid-binding protein YceI